MDVEGAFKGVIARSLNRFNVHRIVMDMSEQLLRNRLSEATKGESTVSGKENLGYPHGGLLSLFIWHLVVNEVMVELTRLECVVVGYANDIMITVRCLILEIPLIQGLLKFVDS